MPRNCGKILLLIAISLTSLAFMTLYADVGMLQATISMSFIVLFSFSWFRRKIYESFLLIHITLSIVVIIALF